MKQTEYKIFWGVCSLGVIGIIWYWMSRLVKAVERMRT